MEQLLKITTVPISIEFKVNNARLEQKRGTVDLEISRDDGSSYFDYEPTSAESQLIKDIITEKIKEEYDQTPQEFCEEITQGPTMGGI